MNTLILVICTAFWGAVVLAEKSAAFYFALIDDCDVGYSEEDYQILNSLNSHAAKIDANLN